MMKITPFKHSCFTVEIDNRVLVIDPGTLSDDFIPTNNIDAVIVTHNHPDHFDPNKLAEIYNKNPKSQLLSLEEITTLMPDHQSTAVTAGDTITVGPFTIEISGERHAEIHPSIPQIANFGALINNTLYYPGDSLHLPLQPIKLLALPIAAPWAKTSEIVDFMLAVRPRQVFPVHDAILSPEGKAIIDRLISGFATHHSVDYSRPAAGEDIVIN